MGIYLLLTLSSMIILFMFISLCLAKYGILKSYSVYATKWLEISPTIPIWSIVTFISAILLLPPLIEVGNNNPLQFLGFFAPVYLIMVAFTPKWESDDMQYKYHMIFAVLCAICGILWSILVADTLYYLLCCIVVNATFGLITRTLHNSLVLYGELVVFETTYMSLILNML